MSKKILVLYTSVGLGHKSIAENIGFHLEQAGYEVKLHDVLQLQSGWLVAFSTKLHQFINKYLPFVWGWLYTQADHGIFADFTLPKRVKAASRNYKHVKAVIDDYQPNLVIATQTSASAIVQYLKQQGWYKGLFGIAFSDYHLHRYWMYEGADFYLVNIAEQKQQMEQLGIASDKIFVIGMTLRPRAQIDKIAVRNKLGIKEDEKVVLVASGSLGTGLNEQWYAGLANYVAQLSKTKLIIVCGKNESLRQILHKNITSDKVLIQGYFSPMAELYAIADIFLTKPGGLSVAESLQWHLPMLITHWLPGQEELNYKYLINNHLVLPKPISIEPASIFPLIEAELASGAFKQSLISNASLVQLTQEGALGKSLVHAIALCFMRFDR